LDGLDRGDLDRDARLLCLHDLARSIQVLRAQLRREQACELTRKHERPTLEERALCDDISPCMFVTKGQSSPESRSRDGTTFARRYSTSTGLGLPASASSFTHSTTPSACEPSAASAASSGRHQPSSPALRAAFASPTTRCAVVPSVLVVAAGERSIKTW
jgi:hypothetical protein